MTLNPCIKCGIVPRLITGEPKVYNSSRVYNTIHCKPCDYWLIKINDIVNTWNLANPVQISSNDGYDYDWLI